MKKLITSMGRLWILGFVLMTSSVMLTMTGCSDDASTSLTNPTANSFEPTGTIQGIVRDSVTLEPIAGAKVSIGVQTATTDAYGQYVLSDVPATSDALNGSIADIYRMTVDLRSVTSPVAMTTATTTPRYPDFVYHDVELKYTSMNDSTPCPDFDPTDSESTDSNDALTTCGTNATNHDTPVEGMVASVTTAVGKLDADITGVVAGCDSAGFEDEFFTPVVAGYIVKLYSDDLEGETDGNSSSGQDGHLIGQTTTDATGSFSFSNVEANLDVTITAESSDGTKVDSIANTTPADGETLALTVQKSTALHVCPNDAHGPEIVSISPETGSDQTPGSTSVAITFSEAVKDTPTASTDASSVGNLYDDIEVNFEGNKAGNVSYSLAWNTARTILTATFTTGASSLYTVRIKDIDSRFTDDNGVAAAMGICDDDTSVPAAYGVVVDAGTTDCTVYFTTGGGTTPGTPTVTLVNSASLDEVGTVDMVLDWAPVSGAKSYKVYCRSIQVWDASTSANGNYDLYSTVTTSSETVVIASYVENGEIELRDECYVTGISSDLVEGTGSATVIGQDILGPLMVAASLVGPTDTNGDGTCETLAVTFNEALDEAVAETIGTSTYTYNLGTTEAASTAATSAVYNPAGPSVTMTFAERICAQFTNDVDETLTVTGVTDVGGNTIRTTGDVYTQQTGVVN